MPQVTRLGLHGGPRPPIGEAATISATISGTASDGLTEAEVVAGGETIVITLTNDTWVASGAMFDAQRQNIIDGLDSDASETNGWNNQVRDQLGVTSVARTSDTVVTITLEAAASYDVTADETITVTVPASALVTSSDPVTAAPTFTVTAAAEVETGRGGHFFPGMVGVRVGRIRKPKEAEEALEEVVEETVSEVLEESPKLEKPRTKPLRRVSEQRRRRIVQSAAQAALSQRILLGELSAIERGIEQLVNRQLEARREALRSGELESRLRERQAQFEAERALELARREDEDLIALITLLLAA